MISGTVHLDTLERAVKSALTSSQQCEPARLVDLSASGGIELIQELGVGKMHLVGGDPDDGTILPVHLGHTLEILAPFPHFIVALVEIGQSYRKFDLVSEVLGKMPMCRMLAYRQALGLESLTMAKSKLISNRKHVSIMPGQEKYVDYVMKIGTNHCKSLSQSRRLRTMPTMHRAQPGPIPKQHAED